jgi:hypothetical protein
VVIHDEQTLEEALLLVDRGPVRYSDRYVYVVVTNRDTLERRARSALGRDDIVVVVPVGMESEMESHDAALRRVKAQRKRQEQKEVREFLRAHPKLLEAETERDALRLYREVRKEEARAKGVAG